MRGDDGWCGIAGGMFRCVPSITGVVWDGERNGKWKGQVPND